MGPVELGPYVVDPVPEYVYDTLKLAGDVVPTTEMGEPV
jgi:hypothetical protein